MDGEVRVNFCNDENAINEAIITRAACSEIHAIAYVSRGIVQE